MLTGQRSIRPGLKRASGWAGLGRAGPNTWHAVTLPRHGRGLLLGFVHSVAHTVWLTVDQRSWFMDLRQGAWWTKSTSLSSGMVYEHRVHAWVASKGNFPYFSHGHAIAGGELVG